MPTTAPEPLDIADLVDLCETLEGADAVATTLGKAGAATDLRLAHALHGLTTAEATVLAPLLARMRDDG